MNHLCSVYQSTQHLFVIFLFQKMASNTSYRVDQRVSIAGKGIGTIAFIGKTEFADGNSLEIFSFSIFLLIQVNGLALFSMNRKVKTMALYKRKVFDE